MPPFKSCRCGWQVLVREQRWAGVLRRWGARGFLSGAAGARSPRHPWQERKIPAWRPGRNPKGRCTQPEQLSPVGVLTCLTSTLGHFKVQCSSVGSYSLCWLLATFPPCLFATKRSNQRTHWDKWLIQGKKAQQQEWTIQPTRLDEVNIILNLFALLTVRPVWMNINVLCSSSLYLQYLLNNFFFFWSYFTDFNNKK